MEHLEQSFPNPIRSVSWCSDPQLSLCSVCNCYCRDDCWERPGCDCQIKGCWRSGQGRRQGDGTIREAGGQQGMAYDLDLFSSDKKKKIVFLYVKLQNLASLTFDAYVLLICNLISELVKFSLYVHILCSRLSQD